jgi:hypothetical protein
MVVGSDPGHEDGQKVRAARQPYDREAAEPNRRGVEEGRRRLVNTIGFSCRVANLAMLMRHARPYFHCRCRLPPISELIERHLLS